MKRSIYRTALFLALGIMLGTSCKKSYSCTCIDDSGNHYNETVKAKNQVEAQLLCEEKCPQ